MMAPAADDYQPLPHQAMLPSTEGSAFRRQAVARITILVVDDSTVIRLLVSRHLQDRGFLTVEVADGQEALEALAVRKFDILITDLEMPRMDGHALLDAVQDQYPLMRRIVMTGFTTINNALSALKYGAIGSVPKPVDTAALDEVVDLAVTEMRLWIRQLSAIRRLHGKEG